MILLQFLYDIAIASVNALFSIRVSFKHWIRFTVDNFIVILS